MTHQIVDKISFQPLEHQVAGFFLEKIIFCTCTFNWYFVFWGNFFGKGHTKLSIKLEF
jgi:hypothetical protein